MHSVDSRRRPRVRIAFGERESVPIRRQHNALRPHHRVYRSVEPFSADTRILAPAERDIAESMGRRAVDADRTRIDPVGERERMLVIGREDGSVER